MQLFNISRVYSSFIVSIDEKLTFSVVVDLPLQLLETSAYGDPVDGRNTTARARQTRLSRGFVGIASFAFANASSL